VSTAITPDEELCPFCDQRIEVWYSDASFYELQETKLVFFERLTERERDVMRYLRTSLTPHEIARALNVTVNTIKTHQRNIYRKLGVTTRRNAVRRAFVEAHEMEE